MSNSETLSIENPHDDESAPQEMHKAVSILHLVCIAFFYVCAGPFAQGEAIAAGGAKWTFVFTVLVPIVFSIPLALISSEQASRLPSCGGCTEWGLILGRFMGITNTYVRSLCAIFDNAIYPVMACDYLASLIPQMNKLLYRTIVVLLANALVLIINIAGLETVGSVSFILAVIIIVPFFLFFCFGASQMTVAKVFADKHSIYGPVDWSLLVSTLIWQYSGFDTVAALSEETKNPKRTFPIALSITIIIVLLVYLLPTISGLSVEPDLSEWESAAFSDISKKLPHCENGWLAYWISIAGVFSALSLLNIAISCTGRETYAGALLDAYPLSRYLGRLDNNMKHEPLPIVALVLMSVLTIPFSFFDFSLLVEWSGLLTVLQQMIQIAAFIALRFPSMVKRMKREQAILRARIESVELSSVNASQQVSIAENQSLEDNEHADDDDFDLSDKFVIPGGWIGVTVVCIPLTAICIFLCVVQGWMSLVISLAMIVAMWLLKGIEIGIKKIITSCKRKSARSRRECGEEINQTSESDESPYK